MGWLVAFGIIGFAWLRSVATMARKDWWVAHIVCAALAGVVGVLWWNGGAEEREAQAALRRAESEEGRAAIAQQAPPALDAEAERKARIEACTQRGIAYFREIEAWPTLSNGANAATEARKRCGRTTGAFP